MLVSVFPVPLGSRGVISLLTDPVLSLILPFFFSLWISSVSGHQVAEWLWASPKGIFTHQFSFSWFHFRALSFRIIPLCFHRVISSTTFVLLYMCLQTHMSYCKAFFIGRETRMWGHSTGSFRPGWK